jgi:tetratricopeptide (TPR) repeat protein
MAKRERRREDDKDDRAWRMKDGKPSILHPPSSILRVGAPTPRIRLAILFAITLLAYIPTYSAGWAWDDDDHITNNMDLKTVGGIKDIWLVPGSLPQYYPLTHSVWWLEYRLWGLAPAGYHVVNVLLHSCAAALLWKLLEQLTVPGAYWAALIFAVHPINVESVAWVTEQKNTLSAIFYILAAMAYLKFEGIGEIQRARKIELHAPSSIIHPPSSILHWKWYILALVLFACAMGSKTAVCSWPAAMALVLWWKGKAINLRRIIELAPFFAVGIGSAAMTAHMEVATVAAHGPAWDWTFAQRCILAGEALWFYVWKLVYPLGYCFSYGRWPLDVHSASAWCAVIGALAVPIALYLARHKIGRGPVVAVLFFEGTLLPALGFFNVYIMRYSLVADHFTYMANVGLITLAVAIIVRCGPALKLSPMLGRLAGTGAIAGLAIATCWQSMAFHDARTLWEDTLAKNPQSSLAHNAMGRLFDKQGDRAMAVGHYVEATKYGSVLWEPSLALGNIYLANGNAQQAREYFRHSIVMRDDIPITHERLATALFFLRDYAGALAEHETAIRLELQRRGIARDQAIKEARALAPPGGTVEGYTRLAAEAEKRGSTAQAIASGLRALLLKPDLETVRVAVEQLLSREPGEAAEPGSR